MIQVKWLWGARNYNGSGWGLTGSPNWGCTQQYHEKYGQNFNNNEFHDNK